MSKHDTATLVQPEANAQSPVSPVLSAAGVDEPGLGLRAHTRRGAVLSSENKLATRLEVMLDVMLPRETPPTISIDEEYHWRYKLNSDPELQVQTRRHRDPSQRIARDPSLRIAQRCSALPASAAQRCSALLSAGWTPWPALISL